MPSDAALVETIVLLALAAMNVVVPVGDAVLFVTYT